MCYQVGDQVEFRVDEVRDKKKIWRKGTICAVLDEKTLRMSYIIEDENHLAAHRHHTDVRIKKRLGPLSLEEMLTHKCHKIRKIGTKQLEARESEEHE